MFTLEYYGLYVETTSLIRRVRIIVFTQECFVFVYMFVSVNIKQTKTFSKCNFMTKYKIGG